MQLSFSLRCLSNDAHVVIQYMLAAVLVHFLKNGVTRGFLTGAVLFITMRAQGTIFNGEIGLQQRFGVFLFQKNGVFVAAVMRRDGKRIANGGCLDGDLANPCDEQIFIGVLFQKFDRFYFADKRAEGEALFDEEINDAGAHFILDVSRDFIGYPHEVT